LLQKAVTEDTERTRICLELLHDEIVILARGNEWAVLPNLLADLLALRVTERTHLLETRASCFHCKLDESVARTRGRRWPEHLDRNIRQRRFYFRPSSVGIRHERA
jgi:hypothetical protein